MDALNELLEDIIFRISSYDIPFILELEGSNKEVVIIIINSSNVWISLLIKLTRNVIIYFLCVFNKHSLFTTYLYYFKYFGFMKKKKLNNCFFSFSYVYLLCYVCYIPPILTISLINILTKNQDEAIIISETKVTDPVISVADLVGDLDVFLNHLAVIRIYIDQPEKVFYAMLRRLTLCEM